MNFCLIDSAFPENFDFSTNQNDFIISVEEPNSDDDRKSRKIETEKSGEEVQGRFFLKDKLCSLGLADVSLL